MGWPWPSGDGNKDRGARREDAATSQARTHLHPVPGAPTHVGPVSNMCTQAKQSSQTPRHPTHEPHKQHASSAWVTHMRTVRKHRALQRP